MDKFTVTVGVCFHSIFDYDNLCHVRKRFLEKIAMAEKYLSPVKVRAKIHKAVKQWFEDTKECDVPLGLYKETARNAILAIILTEGKEDNDII